MTDYSQYPFPAEYCRRFGRGEFAVAGAILQAVMKPARRSGNRRCVERARTCRCVHAGDVPEWIPGDAGRFHRCAGGRFPVCSCVAWKNGIRPLRIILAGVVVNAFLGSGISGFADFYGDRVQGALLDGRRTVRLQLAAGGNALWPYTLKARSDRRFG